MKHISARPMTWLHGLAAALAMTVATGSWFAIQKQEKLLSDQETRPLFTFYGEFSTQYYKLRQQFSLHSNDHEIDISLLRQNLVIFNTMIRQLLAQQPAHLALLSPENTSLIHQFITRSSILLESGSRQTGIAQFRNCADSLEKMQDLVSHLSTNIARIEEDNIAKQKKDLRAVFIVESVFLAISSLLAIASLLLLARQMQKNRQSGQEIERIGLQLNHAQQDLRAFNEEQQELLATIGAALLPPLQNLQQQLDEGKPTAEVRAALSKLNEDLADLLEIAALDSGAGRLKLEDFDFHALLSTLTSEMLIPSRAKGLLLSLEITTDVPIMLHGNALRIRQILQTLIENAIKHTNKGRIRINAYTAGRRSKRPRLRVDISDTGCGIAPQDLPFIFKTTGKAPDAVCRNIRQARSLARHMDGDLSVASRVFEGTTFTLDLPLQSAPQQE